MKVPFVDLKLQYQNIKTEIDSSISNVINDTAFIGGKYVDTFEKEFALKYGVKHLKRIGTISFANVRPPDYWAEQGYDYYTGH